jgi:Suppressor of fused protein (SUFU)
LKRVEIFLRHVEGIGGRKCEYNIMSDGQEPLVAVVAFRDVPGVGSVTSFSYGLSLGEHPKWLVSRPELVLSVDSSDAGWALAPGELVRRGRGRVGFLYGEVLRFGEPVAGDSAMSSFVVYACASIGAEDLVVRLPGADVHLVQVYPIYDSEISLIERLGVERFFSRLGANVFDVRRAPCVE